MNKTILISGAAGFIGSHLTQKLLDKDFKIILIDNFSGKKKDRSFKKFLNYKNVKFFNVDLKKKINLNIKKIDYIFHLASNVGVKNINKLPFESFINNVLSTINIIDFARQLRNNPKLILFSTSEVYSPLIQNKKVKFPLSEKNNILIENKVISRDAYYLSKIFNEKITQLSSLNFLILRPHNIYGPRMGYNHVIPELIKKLKKNKITNNIYIHSPKHTRAFCYIDDAIEQIIKLSFQKGTNKKTFNIGNMNEEIKIFELAKKIRNKLKKNRIGLKEGKVTEGSPVRRIPDMSLTLKKIKKKKKFIDLNSGLDLTINWYGKNDRN